MADQLRPRWPGLAALTDEGEHDVLAYMGFPAQHRAKPYSTNPLERLNKEVKRRADVVGIFPGEVSIIRLIGAVLLEANDEWQLQHRYMQVEAMAEPDAAADRGRSYTRHVHPDHTPGRVTAGHLSPEPIPATLSDAARNRSPVGTGTGGNSLSII